VLVAFVSHSVGVCLGEVAWLFWLFVCVVVYVVKIRARFVPFWCCVVLDCVECCVAVGLRGVVWCVRCCVGWWVWCVRWLCCVVAMVFVCLLC